VPKAGRGPPFASEITTRLSGLSSVTAIVPMPRVLVDGNVTIALRPPHSDHKGWCTRIMDALGTGSADFVNTEVERILAAVQPREGVPDEAHLNAALAGAPNSRSHRAPCIRQRCRPERSQSDRGTSEQGNFNRASPARTRRRR
jgi:hypothetical protein